MDQRTYDIELLRKARRELVDIDNLNKKIKKYETKISNSYLSVNMLKPEYEERDVHHEERLREIYTVKAKNKKRVKIKAIIAINIIINLLIFIGLTAYIWLNRTGTHWAGNGELGVLPWIGHVVIGIVLCFIPFLYKEFVKYRG